MSHQPATALERSGDSQAGGEWTVSIVNEFASVHVRKVLTRNGERLEISSPQLAHAVRLDALELEALSWQSPEFFSKLLETPLGPEDA